MEHTSNYKSYILRVWQTEQNARPVLSAVLEDCETGARQTFPSLALLVEFLMTCAVPAPPPYDLETEEWVY